MTSRTAPLFRPGLDSSAVMVPPSSTRRTVEELEDELRHHWELFEVIQAEAETSKPRPDGREELERWIHWLCLNEVAKAKAFELVGRISALKWALGEDWDSAMLWNEESERC